MGFYIGWNEEDLIMARAGRIVAAKDENGREYIYQSVNSAVAELNISPTTIRRYAKNGGTVMTRFGLVEIEFRDEYR